MLTPLRVLSRAPRPFATGLGLELRPWDRGLVEQMARWGAHGFPYSAFDLQFLARRYGFTAAAVEDTMISSRLLEAGQRRPERGFHSLAAVARYSASVSNPRAMPD